MRFVPVLSAKFNSLPCAMIFFLFTNSWENFFFQWHLCLRGISCVMIFLKDCGWAGEQWADQQSRCQLAVAGYGYSGPVTLSAYIQYIYSTWLRSKLLLSKLLLSKLLLSKLLLSKLLLSKLLLSKLKLVEAFL